MNKKIIVIVALCLLFTACSNDKRAEEIITTNSTTISTEPIIEVEPGDITDLDKTNSEPATIRESKFEIQETEPQENSIGQIINDVAKYESVESNSED